MQVEHFYMLGVIKDNFLGFVKYGKSGKQDFRLSLNLIFRKQCVYRSG